MRSLAFSLLLALAAGAVQGQIVDKKTLSFEAAARMAAAAEADARGRGLAVVVVVVDDGGHVILLHRMNGAQVASVDVGIGKARTAAIFRRPSRVFEEQVKNGRVAALALPGATALIGGVPVVVGGQVVGAIGVSGDAPDIDEAIAFAGAKALQ